MMARVEHVAEYVAFGAYFLAGPMAAGLLGVALIKGRKRMMLLGRRAEDAAAAATGPKVSILIPAKDEVERIGDCLRSAIEQDYPNVEVIAVDDRSTDGTSEKMDEVALASDGRGRLKVIHIGAGNPPPGWTGKCNALHTAMQHASGEWLLFVDSDVVLERTALSTLVGFAIRREAGLVSLFPKLECHSFWESLLVPLAGGALGAMHLVALTNHDHKRQVSFANGQCLLFHRPVYEAIGGHEAVKGQFCEDVAFGQLTKAAGYRVRISWGAEYAAVRMYSSLAAIRRGWARIFFAAGMGKPWRIFLAIGFVLLCVYSAYPAIAWGIYRNAHPVNVFQGWGWIGAGLVHLGLLTGFLGAMYTWSGNRWRNALLLPLGAGMLLGIFAKSLEMCLTGKVEWRGTQYGPSKAAAENSKVGI